MLLSIKKIFLDRSEVFSRRCYIRGIYRIRWKVIRHLHKCQCLLSCSALLRFINVFLTRLLAFTHRMSSISNNIPDIYFRYNDIQILFPFFIAYFSNSLNVQYGIKNRHSPYQHFYLNVTCCNVQYPLDISSFHCDF